MENARQLSSFMRYFNSNLAREVARLVGWRHHVWSRRYQAIVVSDEPEAQVARLRYMLSQGVKEGLVAHPAEWPGAHSVRALLEEDPVAGYWFDRSKEYFARRKGESFGRLQYATRGARQVLRAAYRAFAGAYRRAAQSLRAGDRTVLFPVGSFPPALPFVGG